MSSFFNKLQGSVNQLTADFKSKLGSDIEHSHTHHSGACTEGIHANQTDNRYVSFAPERQAGNDVKWYVDGCSYMYAVSIALEQARESIWIMDCMSSYLYYNNSILTLLLQGGCLQNYTCADLLHGMSSIESTTCCKRQPSVVSKWTSWCIKR